MKYLLYLWVGLVTLSPAYAAATVTPTTSHQATAVEPVKRKAFWERLRDKVRSYWQAFKEKLRTMADDLVRLLIIALIVALIVSILYWLLPWPFDVIIMLIALIVLVIFLLRYI
ncbi:MAG: DUF4349 domain-containing protein [Bacteroidia bacterium]|nr:DUF4349 domain-containing protein [Bacteroidia bacterium]